MASIAEVSVTVLPSEPVDTTSFYKERPTPGTGGGRPTGEPTRDYRTGWCARVPAVRSVRLHDLWHTFATMQSVGGCAFHTGLQVARTSFVRADAEHLSLYWVRVKRHPMVVATRVRGCRGLSVPCRRGDRLSWSSADSSGAPSREAITRCRRRDGSKVGQTPPPSTSRLPRGRH
jgi:hypothetical protein